MYLDSQPANGPDKPIKVSMVINDLMLDSIQNFINSTGDYTSDGFFIKLVNDNLEISGDRGTGEDNWNGTWRMIYK